MHSTQDIQPKPAISSFAKRLQIRRKQLNLSKQMLATAIGVSLTTIQLYESHQLPKAQFAVKLASTLNCSLDWLLVGSEYTDKQNIAVNDTKFMAVPTTKKYFPSESHTLEIDLSIKNAYRFRLDFLQGLGNPATMLLLKVAGDSMYPKIVNNDTVLIDTDMNKPRPGGIFAVEIEGMIYLKITNAIPGKLILSSLNSNYSPIEINTEQDKIADIIIGEVLWVGRELV